MSSDIKRLDYTLEVIDRLGRRDRGGPEGREAREWFRAYLLHLRGELLRNRGAGLAELSAETWLQAFYRAEAAVGRLPAPPEEIVEVVHE